jgi:hypothetical protein
VKGVIGRSREWIRASAAALWERAKAETDLKWSSRWLQASVCTYATRLTDLIVRVPSSVDGMREPVLRRDNASHGYRLGAEGELSQEEVREGFYGLRQPSRKARYQTQADPAKLQAFDKTRADKM